MKNKKISKIEQNKKSILQTGWIIILIGVIVLLSVILANEYFATENFWLDVIFTLLSNLAVTVITIGGGTVLYSYFDFVNYVKNSLEDIILEYKFIKNLNNNQKESLLNKISKDLTYQDENSSDSTLYCFVNNEIKELNKNIYYEQLRLNVTCLCKDNKIIKNIIRKFTVNYENDNKYEFDLKRITNMDFIDDSTSSEPLKVSLLKINGQDLTDKIEFKYNIRSAFNQYTKECYYEFKSDYIFKKENFLTNGKKILRIEIHYETSVPKRDNTMAFRVYAPCKSFVANFSYDTHTIKDVFCDAFAFKDRKTNNRTINEELIQYTTNKNNVCIQMDNWILPGDGVIYVITPK